MKPVNSSPSPATSLPDSGLSSGKLEQKNKSSGSSVLARLLGHFKPGKNSFPNPMSGNFTSLTNTPADSIPALSPVSGKTYAVNVDPPSDINSKIQLAIDAELAAYPYHQSFSKVSAATESRKGIDGEFFSPHKNWDTARPLALAVGQATGLSTKGSEGFIYDKKSGLTAYVLHNNTLSPAEVRLVFGGTSSGKKAGGLLKRSILNGSFSLNQWKANGKNALLGKIPDSFKQAKKMTKQLQISMQADPLYRDAKLVVSGHSKGAGEAAYAALSQSKPVEALCFSSAELGSEIHKSLSEESKANAARHVSHYNIQGDIVPNLNRLNSRLGHIGKVTTVPSESKLNSPIDRHDQFTRHIRTFASQ